ncbi:hypothetical protein L9F63_028107, partial [Diploptera punctata]
LAHPSAYLCPSFCLHNPLHPVQASVRWRHLQWLSRYLTGGFCRRVCSDKE